MNLNDTLQNHYAQLSAAVKQYSNGLVLGKCLMWNVIYGKLLIKAEFPTPYDWEKNMIIPKLQSQDASSFPITNQNSHQ